MQHVTIYTKENCSFCTKAKMLLTNRGMSYNEMKLNEDFTKENLLELYPNVMTFPVIVIDGFNIGGFTELNKVLSESVKDNRKILTEEV